MSSPKIKLNNGMEIPAIGYGTWQAPEDQVATVVEHALKAGYRHIDCAWSYDNEVGVGQGIKASGILREEIFITSKLWCTYHRKVEENLDDSLKRLGTDYLDLYLIHWPCPLNPNGNHYKFPMRSNGVRDIDEEWVLKDTWKQMEEMVKKGKVKAIGVSNFSKMKLDEILPYAEIKPVVDQLELHLYNPQHKLLEYLKSHDIVPQAYSPLGSTGSPLLTDETAIQLATKYEVPVSAVLLGYLLRRNIVILPKSVTPSRIEENLRLSQDFASRVSDEDFKILDSIAVNGKQKRFIMPPWPLQLGFEDWIQKF
ncbi:hypothetical protein Clacol_009373 [Clathrus columnatus]|uniref:NADP-dependent oxidoreductase domain-containing protein n=1 Tax=Clathrus columnatus TaxID=1419009 RepID=A0AAV5APY0_9AGAM|nr:hypothetical protein Clacol_009373 [Clathrus columnatus]